MKSRERGREVGEERRWKREVERREGEEGRERRWKEREEVGRRG